MIYNLYIINDNNNFVHLKLCPSRISKRKNAHNKTAKRKEREDGLTVEFKSHRVGSIVSSGPSLPSGEQ